MIFHNDPLTLRDSKELKARELLLSQCYKIIFISNWIQNRFFTSFTNANYNKTEIIYHGVKKNIIKNIKKKKNILFVGKLNEAKGYSIFVEAATKFNKINKEWNFISIGNETRKKIFPDKKIINEIGYKDNKKVLEYYENSEISVGNSVWNEPLGRIAIESSSRKCLPIISNIAGLAESKKIAVVLKKNTSLELLKTLIKFTKSDILRKKLQNKFYLKNDFDIKKISNSIDNIRSDILYNNPNKQPSKNIKILHIANFNELSDGRLFYSFANKLNNGFIKNNNIVHTISDRFYLKNSKNIFNLRGNHKKFNNKILNTLKNFSPDLVLFGHVFNIEQEIFDYCNKYNIKKASWFIDSISKEFLDKNKKNLFKRLVNNMDKTFITSSPKLFKNTKIFKKMNFIPNPVDSSIDYFRNYMKNDLKYDVFLAISHGQNRTILKKGKTDEREKLFSFITHNLSKHVITSFGMNSIEPIWGSNYFYHLSKSKIAINISRGKYQNLYSSDRISSLMGNGLLVFLDQKTNLNKLFKDKKEAVFFNNKKDLVKKINYYLRNEKKRIKIAEAGCLSYHKNFNNINVAKFILTSLNFDNQKINWVRYK